MRIKPRLAATALMAVFFSPFTLYAARVVTTVPKVNTNVGGAAGGSAVALAAPGTSSGLQLSAPILGGTFLAPAAAPQPVIEARPGEVAGRQEEGTPAAPKVGDEKFREVLQSVGDGSREIRAASKDEKSDATIPAGIGKNIFDGSEGAKDAKPGGIVDGGGGGLRGFGAGAGTPGGPNFVRSLLSYGMPRAPAARLLNIMKTSHPGDPKTTYHNLDHSIRVPNTMAAFLDGSAGVNLSPGVKATLLIAAALHDIDPKRRPGTPARVPATLEFLDADPEVQAFFKDLKVSKKTVAQIKTLIKFTDFNADPKVLAEIQRDAEAMAREHFGADAGRWSELGRLLAFADQSAMYLDTPEFAHQAVVGLAHEIRAAAGGAATPTDETILQGTAGFLKPLALNPDYAHLPAEMKVNFLRVLAHFERLAVPPSPAREDQGRQRAPPAAMPKQVDADPMLVSLIEHDASSYKTGYAYEGRPLQYAGGGGQKLLFRHPRDRDLLVTLFPKKSSRNLKGLAKVQADSERVEAAMASRANRAAELAGRSLLEGHGLTPRLPMRAGRSRMLDSEGEEWNTSYFVQESVHGVDAVDAYPADLALVRALFDKLIALRLRLIEDVNLSRNIRIGWTASDPAKKAYVVDAQGTEYVGEQGRFARWTKRTDPLAAHYHKMFAQIQADNIAASSKRAGAPLKSPHPIKSEQEAAARKADETSWWLERDFDGARGPIMTLGDALSKVTPADLPKLKARLREVREGVTWGKYRDIIAEGAGTGAAYLYFINESGRFQGEVRKGFSTGLPLERLYAVNKVTRDNIEMPEADKFEAPAFAMGVVYNLLFDYAGRLRDPVKVDYLIDHVLAR